MAAAWVLGLVTSIAYWSHDTVPPRWDAALHLMHCLEYRDILREGHVLSFLWKHYAYYPPLVYQITGLLHLLLGPSPWVAWAVMQAFALALGLATWRLARAVGGPLAASLAAVTVLLLPIVVVFTREFGVDVPLMAASTALLALVLDDPLRTRGRAVALGAVMGMGMLIKWTFALTAVGPLLYLAIAAARGRVARRHWIATALAAMLAVPWYAWSLPRLWADSRHNAVVVAAQEGDPPLASLGSLVYYATTAVNEWFYLPLAVLVVWGIVAAMRERGRAMILLNIAVWPAYALFTLIPNKDSRYGLPMVPALCIAAAQAIASLRTAGRRRIAAGVPIALLTVQHVAGVVGLGPLSARTTLCLPGLSLHLYDPADPPVYFRFRSRLSDRPCNSEWTLYNPYSYFGHQPRHEDWRIDAVVAAIPADALVQLPADDVHLNPTLLAYVARRMGRPIRWAPPEEASVTVARATAPDERAAGCQRFDQPDGTQVAVCRR